MFTINNSNAPHKRAKKEASTTKAAAADNSLVTTEVAAAISDLANQFITLSEQVAELAASKASN